MSALVGLTGGASAAAQATAITACGLTSLPIGQCYFDVAQSWASGMWNGSYYVGAISQSILGIVAVPMIVGAQVSTHLSSALSTSGAITSLPINAMAGFGGITTGTIIPSGSMMTTLTGTHYQAWTVTSNVAVGATSIPVVSQTPNFAYGSGVGIKGSGWGISPQAATDTTNGNGNVPTFMKLTDVASGVWDGMFAKTFAATALRRPAAILRIGWELYGNTWYPWNGLENAVAHKNAYTHLVDLARASSAQFTFEWDGGVSLYGYTPWTDGAYPGDSYVDYIGGDLYNDVAPNGVTGWLNGVSDKFSAGMSFATSVNKPYCIPEFGLSGVDDLAWVNEAFTWIHAQAGLGFALFFSDTSPSTITNTSTYPTSAPRAAALIGQYGQDSINYLNSGGTIRGAAGMDAPPPPPPPSSGNFRWVYRPGMRLRLRAAGATTFPSNTITVTTPSAQTSVVGTVDLLQIVATDSSGATMTYAVSNQPTGLTINSSTGLISGTPTVAGSYTVSVSVSDVSGAVGTATFAWIVSASSMALGNTFEGIANGVALTSGSGGSTVPGGNYLNSIVVPTGGTLVASTAVPMHGSVACRIVTGSSVASGYVSWLASLPAALTDFYVRAEYQLPAGFYTGTTGGAGLIVLRTSPDASAGRIDCNANGNVTIKNAAGTVVATSTDTLTLATKFRIEAHFTMGGSGACTVRVYQSANLDGNTPDITVTASSVVFSSTAAEIRYGVATAPANMTTYIDSIAFNPDSWVGPAGTGTGGPTGMEFGSYNNLNGDTASSLHALCTSTGLGTGTVRRRSFSASCPAWSSHPAAQDVAQGLLSFASVEPPGGQSAAGAAAVASGAADSQIASFVGAAPAGTLVTMFHDPEAGLTQAQFRAMIAKFCIAAKNANPDVKVGYVAMEYQWSIGNGYTTLDVSGLNLDYLACDLRGYYWNIGTSATIPIQTMTGFSQWYAWAKTKSLPLRIAEIAVHSTDVDLDANHNTQTHVFTDAQRQAWLGASLDWMAANSFASVSYWNVDEGTAPSGVQWSIAGGTSSPLASAAWRARNNTNPVLGTPPAGMNYAVRTLANTGAEAKTTTLSRTRTAIYGDVTLSPGSPTLTDADVYGRVLCATSGSAYDVYLDNVFVHGTDLGFAALQGSVAPGNTSTNYESSRGLVTNTAVTNCTVHMDGVTLRPDYPDSRWDGLLGHHFTSDGWGLAISHTTDGIGLQNASGGTTPPLNCILNGLWVDFLCYWSYSPGSPNTPQETHNDCIQGFGGTNVTIGAGSWLGARVSCADGFVRADGAVHNDPFGYVGNGSSYVPSSGSTAQGNANANIQMNKTEGDWNNLHLNDVYLAGGNFGVNGTTGIVYVSCDAARVRFTKNSAYNFPPRYPIYNTQASGTATGSIAWNTTTCLYNDGTTLGTAIR